MLFSSVSHLAPLPLHRLRRFPSPDGGGFKTSALSASLRETMHRPCAMDAGAEGVQSTTKFSMTRRGTPSAPPRDPSSKTPKLRDRRHSALFRFWRYLPPAALGCGVWRAWGHYDGTRNCTAQRARAAGRGGDAGGCGVWGVRRRTISLPDDGRGADAPRPAVGISSLRSHSASDACPDGARTCGRRRHTRRGCCGRSAQWADVRDAEDAGVR